MLAQQTRVLVGANQGVAAPASLLIKGYATAEAHPEPTNNSHKLSKEAYWKQFYKQQRKEVHPNFEWLTSYEVLKPFILPLMPKQPYRLLDVGCGESTLAIDLCLDSPVPSQSLCIDISPDALLTLQEKMRDIHLRSFSRVDFLQADILNMPVQSGSMDIVIDKGTMDSFLKDEDRDRAHARAVALYKECLRVLKPTGSLIQITDEDPALRMALLNPFPCKDPAFSDLKVNYRIIEGEGTPEEHFIYTIRHKTY
jgi:SAM-dependent methyltransferase